MAVKRCPLCMEILKNGECTSCGYKLPDEEDISSLYDYEPDEYPEPAVREITPEVQMEEIYPNRTELKFKVRDDEGHTVRSKIDLKKPDKNQTGNPNASDGNPNASNGNPNASNGNPNASDGNPYAGFTPVDAGNNRKSPFAYPPANTSEDTETAAGFIKKYWWILLISFFAPIVGLILNATLNSELSKYKARQLVIAAIVLGFILPPW